MKKSTGAIVATMVAGLFLSGKAVAESVAPATPAAKVKCSGVNSCKGTAACKGAEHACKGANGCKGKGWIEVDDEKACTDKGGTVVKG